MLTYPILEWCFGVFMKIPGAIIAATLAIWIILSFFGHDEIRDAIIALIAAPLIAYGFCYLCKIAQESFPIIGVALIMLRLVVDASLIIGVIMIIRYLIGK